MTDTTPTTVGRVLGTEDSTPLEFWVAVSPGHHLQLDDVVAIDRTLPNGESISIYGIVGQVRARHEGARFDSDVFLIADGILPTRNPTRLRSIPRPVTARRHHDDPASGTSEQGERATVDWTEDA